MFEIKNLTEEKVFIFILCYSYNLNLLHIFKLYDLSDRLFKSFLMAFQPTLKLSTSRLVTLRTQAKRVFDLVNGKIDKKVKETDKFLAQILSRHIGKIYVCGENFLTLESLADKNFQYITEEGEHLPITYEDFMQHYKNIKRLFISGRIYHQTTPVSFLLCKYYSEKNTKEVLNLGLTDLHKMLENVNG